MKIYRLVAALGLTVSLATATLADSTLFSFGQTNVQVRADNKFCALNATHTFDKAWLDIQIKSNAGNNEVVGAYLLCDELEQQRLGARISNSRWIILLAPTQGGAKAGPISGYTRQQIVDLLAKEFDKGVKLDVDAVNKSVNKATREVTGTDDLPPIEISSSGAPSLLAKTDTGVFAGLKLQVSTADGPASIGAVIGMTLVNDHMLSVNVYRHFKDPKTINMLLGEASVMIDKIVDLND